MFGEDKKIKINKVNQILKFCHLDDLVENLPESKYNSRSKWKTPFRGSGTKIGYSKGLYQDRDILILDEATNALDSDTEDKILKIF